MALLPVKIYPDPLLKQKSVPLTDFGPKTQQFFEDMIETMYVEDGVGLAAPQVGVSRRVLVACPTMKEGEAIILVNPEIYESQGREKGPEGCLSLPGISGDVHRAKKIRFRYQDREGKACDAEAKDFYARIIQHEIDHLDGILLIDRLDFDTRQKVLSEYAPRL